MVPSNTEMVFLKKKNHKKTNSLSLNFEMCLGDIVFEGQDTGCV